MLKGRVAIITGATRGIGSNVAMTLAKNGCNIVVAGKSIKHTGQLPGTVHSVSQTLSEYGATVLPYAIDVRDSTGLKELVDTTIRHFGKIDILINNAGALWWKNIVDTPVNKYDLVNNINSRAAYVLSQLCLPHMLKNEWGHIIMQSPPITSEYIDGLITDKKINNKTAYIISKLGMSITACGIAQEYGGSGVAANTLWPMTPIESYALINNNLGNPKLWRKPQIISDTILNILQEDPVKFTGNCLIDETYLRAKGVEDFSKYQCVSGYEPPKLDDVENEKWLKDSIQGSF